VGAGEEQDILINVTVFTDTIRAAETDDINDCVDYSALAKKIQNHAETAATLDRGSAGE
jgi:FolB domain-containing protein